MLFLLIAYSYVCFSILNEISFVAGNVRFTHPNHQKIENEIKISNRLNRHCSLRISFTKRFK